MGKGQCEQEGCSKQVQGGGTPCCIGHGGGRRCQQLGCPKSAVRGTPHCIAHGGGKRCEREGCSKSAQPGTCHCKAHGGGTRCAHHPCRKPAQGGGTPYCQAHGGGKRCTRGGCTKRQARVSERLPGGVRGVSRPSRPNPSRPRQWTSGWCMGRRHL
jgi:hypothetical protein